VSDIPNEDVLSNIVGHLVDMDREDLQALLTCLDAHAKHVKQSVETMGDGSHLPFASYLKIDAKTGEFADAIPFDPGGGMNVRAAE